MDRHLGVRVCLGVRLAGRTRAGGESYDSGHRDTGESPIFVMQHDEPLFAGMVRQTAVTLGRCRDRGAHAVSSGVPASFVAVVNRLTIVMVLPILLLCQVSGETLI
ncbi:hypothetical protein FHR32_004429 [Streptosporangium album]|uniref:Uncharacterized protein n=1 Tax=Streptosporangium album TaxID=47479 RepID=A0A7W7WBE7_9ACTN|nr:hypothetical protein [Streptosporangium album]MBB4940124.1 hypothetical protein [Streptosporangium album]